MPCRMHCGIHLAIVNLNGIKGFASIYNKVKKYKYTCTIIHSPYFILCGSKQEKARLFLFSDLCYGCLP